MRQFGNTTARRAPLVVRVRAGGPPPERWDVMARRRAGVRVAIRLLFAATIGIMLVIGPSGRLPARSVAAAQTQRPNCGNFLSQQDAQAALNADPSDPFGLDADHNGVACDGSTTAFGTPPLVNCADLQGHDAVANALYQLSLSEYGSDRYSLAGCAAQAAAGVSPSAGAAPSTNAAPPAGMSPPAGPAVVAIAAPAGTGESLDAALEARFAALEAGFAAFAGEPATGAGNAPASGQSGGAGMVVSSSPPAAPTAAPTAGSTAPASSTPTTVTGGHGHHHHHKHHHNNHHGHGHHKNHKHHKH